VLRNGFGVETNYAVSVTWLRKAAEHTNYVAMKDLGVLYMNGTEVPGILKLQILVDVRGDKRELCASNV